MRATVILQKCTHTRKTFGIRVQEMEDGEWYRTWAFPIDEASAKREGYDASQIMSLLPALPEYPGCPYCEAKGYFYDTNCGKISCMKEESSITCPWCDNTYHEFVPLKDKMKHVGTDR